MSHASADSKHGKRRRSDLSPVDWLLVERVSKRILRATSPNKLAIAAGFSCPYRKKYASIFNVRDHPDCALTAFNDVAAVGEHVLKHHMVASAFKCRLCEYVSTQRSIGVHSPAPGDVCIGRMESMDGISQGSINRISELLGSLTCLSSDSRIAESAWTSLLAIILPEDRGISPEFVPVIEHFELHSKNLSQLQGMFAEGLHPGLAESIRKIVHNFLVKAYCSFDKSSATSMRAPVVNPSSAANRLTASDTRFSRDSAISSSRGSRVSGLRYSNISVDSGIDVGDPTREIRRHSHITSIHEPAWRPQGFGSFATPRWSNLLAGHEHTEAPRLEVLDYTSRSKRMSTVTSSKTVSNLAHIEEAPSVAPSHSNCSSPLTADVSQDPLSSLVEPMSDPRAESGDVAATKGTRTKSFGLPKTDQIDGSHWDSSDTPLSSPYGVADGDLDRIFDDDTQATDSECVSEDEKDDYSIDTDILGFVLQVAFDVDPQDAFLPLDKCRALTSSFMRDLGQAIQRPSNSSSPSGDCPTHSASHSAVSSSSARDASDGLNGGARKGKRSGELCTPGEGIGESGPRTRISKRRKTDKLASARLSCPYRKRNPGIFNVREHYSCSMTFFPTMTAVRQHILAKHRRQGGPGFICERCKSSFQSRGDLQQHLRVPNQQMCETRDLDPVGGIDAVVARHLVGRGKPIGRPIEDEWRELWDLLFPEDSEILSYKYHVVMEHFEFRDMYRESLPDLIMALPALIESLPNHEHKFVPRDVVSNLVQALPAIIMALDWVGPFVETSLQQHLGNVVMSCETKASMMPYENNQSRREERSSVRTSATGQSIGRPASGVSVSIADEPFPMVESLAETAARNELTALGSSSLAMSDPFESYVTGVSTDQPGTPLLPQLPSTGLYSTRGTESNPNYLRRQDDAQAACAHFIATSEPPEALFERTSYEGCDQSHPTSSNHPDLVTSLSNKGTPVFQPVQTLPPEKVRLSLTQSESFMHSTPEPEKATPLSEQSQPFDSLRYGYNIFDTSDIAFQPTDTIISACIPEPMGLGLMEHSMALYPCTPSGEPETLQLIDLHDDDTEKPRDSNGV